MNPKVYTFFLSLGVLYLFPMFWLKSQGTLSIQEVFQSAYEFARTHEKFLYTESKAREWARSFIEKKTIFPFSKTLYQNYLIAYEFALSSEGLRLDPKSANSWAKRILLNSISSIFYLREELLEFKRQGNFQQGEFADWLQEFLSSPSPIYFHQSMEDVYQEILLTFQEELNIVFTEEKGLEESASLRSYSFQEIQEKSLFFIRQRYYFAEDKTLLSQYREALQFALWIFSQRFPEQPFPMLQARRWAKIFITQNGKSALAPLDIQYQNAYVFAQHPQGLNMTQEQAEAWAIHFIEQKARSHSYSLLEQYQQAYRFAYTSSFLRIFKERLPTRGIFLQDEAQKWAKKFIFHRGRLKNISVMQQYLEAFHCAFSTNGLALSKEESYKWALRFLMKPYKP